MIVSIPDTITYQELERKLILKKTYGEVLNHKLKTIIARERVQSTLQKELAGAEQFAEESPFPDVSELTEDVYT